jgi:RNA polymerase sigma-70 factor (sigma-E family)
MVARGGDAEQFAAWARGRMDALLRFGRLLAGDVHSAEDLVQTALAQTWAAWPRVRRHDDPEGYVRRVMVNTQIGEWRRRQRRRLASVPTSGDVDDASVGMVDQTDPLWRALVALPPRQRGVVIARYCEDRSEAETASLLGCSVGTVKSQAAKGLAKLRAALGESVMSEEL